MDALTLNPTLTMWLVSPEDAKHAGDLPGRYAEAGSGQKIFYDPASITEDLVLERAFATLGEPAPTVEQAARVFAEVKALVPHYAFEALGDTWHIRNRSRPSFANPLIGRRWSLGLRSHESATTWLELEGSEVKEAFAWLPLLDGHHSEATIAAHLRTSPIGQRLFDALETVQGFGTILEERFALEELPELLFMSHSSVLVRGGRASILIDPALLLGTEILAREGRRPFEIAASVDAILVSHCHWDHLSFQTMLRVPRTTTIFVPRSTRPALVNPPLKVYLEAFGFEDVREVSDWETARIGDVEITFVPFFGEPFGLDSRFDAFTYLVRANGKTIYGSLDACHDEAGDMDPVLERLGLEQGRDGIDVFLFGSSAQKHDPLYRAANMRHYSNELVRRPDLVRYHPNVDDVRRWCGLLRPRAIVPYANFIFYGTTQRDVRLADGSNVAAHWMALGDSAPAYSRPWRDELARLAASVTAPLLMLHPMQGLRLSG